MSKNIMRKLFKMIISRPQCQDSNPVRVVSRKLQRLHLPHFEKQRKGIFFHCLRGVRFSQRIPVSFSCAYKWIRFPGHHYVRCGCLTGLQPMECECKAVISQLINLQHTWLKLFSLSRLAYKEVTAMVTLTVN